MRISRAWMLALLLVGMLLFVAPVDAAPTDLDTGFGSGGAATVPTCVQYGSSGVGLQLLGANAGKLVIAGRLGSTSYPCITDVLARLTSGGELDTSFGSGGYAVTPLANFQVASMAIGVDDSIYLLGSAPGDPSDPSQIELVLAHYTAGGVLDQTFGSNGVATLALYADPWTVPPQLALQPNGAIVVTANGILSNGFGSGCGCWYVARFTPAGALDPAFGVSGIATYVPPGVLYGIVGPSVVAVQSDGNVIVGGEYDGPGALAAALVRFDPAGNLDPSFGSVGVLTDPLGPLADGQAPSALLVGPDDSLTIAGSSSDGTELLIGRYDADGQALDPSFDSGSIESLPLPPGKVGGVGPMVLAPNGDVVGSGSTSSPPPSGSQDVPSTNPQPFLLGLTADGSPDTSFGPDGLLFENSTGNGDGIVVQPDGEFVQTGTDFFGVPGASAGVLVRRFIGFATANPHAPSTPSPPLSRPSNRFTVHARITGLHADVRLTLDLPGPGLLNTLATYHSGERSTRHWGRTDKIVNHAGVTVVNILPNPAGKTLLTRDRRFGRVLHLGVCIKFTPTAGITATKCLTVTVLTQRHPHTG